MDFLSKKDASPSLNLNNDRRPGCVPFPGTLTNCNVNYCGEGTTKTLCTDQNIPMGSVTFNNDKDANIYITYSAAGAIGDRINGNHCQ
ncbi:MAG: hypothetical protein HY252_18005 [Sphingobacteriales bacterium]|nr:hypothetical protein [Sphingobacteriales bacterium]